MKKILPTIISRLFDPIIVLTVLSVMAILRSGMPLVQMERFFVVFFFAMVLPPVLLFIWAVRTHRVSNLDVSNRNQRIAVLASFSVFLIIDFLFVTLFANIYLVNLFFIFFLWFAGFFGITLFWKISGHAAISTFAATVIIGWFEWSFWPILLIIPLVSWARVVRKNHTVAQVVGGVLYSVSFIGLMRLTGII